MERTADEFLGLTLSDVEEKCSNYRIVAEDNEHFAVTLDFDETRINIEIFNGIVTDAYWG